MIIRKIGIIETSKNAWRVTYDGRVLGDGGGYAKAAAIVLAKAIIARPDDGDWRGSEWVHRKNIIDPDSASF